MITNQNMLQMLQFLKGNQNPEQFVYNMVKERSGGNPLILNLIALAESGKGNEIEQIARNIMKEQGKDFDTEFNQFKSQFGLK